MKHKNQSNLLFIPVILVSALICSSAFATLTVNIYAYDENGTLLASTDSGFQLPACHGHRVRFVATTSDYWLNLGLAPFSTTCDPVQCFDVQATGGANGTSCTVSLNAENIGEDVIVATAYNTSGGHAELRLTVVEVTYSKSIAKLCYEDSTSVTATINPATTVGLRVEFYVDFQTLVDVAGAFPSASPHQITLTGKTGQYGSTKLNVRPRFTTVVCNGIDVYVLKLVEINYKNKNGQFVPMPNTLYICKGDTVVFRAEADPNVDFEDDDPEWETAAGQQTGTQISVTFNDLGPEVLSAKCGTIKISRNTFVVEVVRLMYTNHEGNTVPVMGTVTVCKGESVDFSVELNPNDASGVPEDFEWSLDGNVTDTGAAFTSFTFNNTAANLNDLRKVQFKGCGKTFDAQVLVVELDRIDGPTKVGANRFVLYTAIAKPPGANFPQDMPQWTGDGGVSGQKGSTAEANFNVIGFHTITAACGDKSVDLLVEVGIPKIELFRDAAFSKPLTDWPATATAQHSPRYLFSIEHAIYVQVTDDFFCFDGNATIDVRVRSQADATGTLIKVTKASTGSTIYTNLDSTGTNILNLGEFSSSNMIGSQIKVIDEEDLTFDFPAYVGPTISVMVDKAEFSSCAIKEFKSDNKVITKQGLTYSKISYSASGIQEFADSITGAGNAMARFIRNAGGNDANFKEADFLFVGSHGMASGPLINGEGNVVLDPANIAANELTNDIDWIILDSCSQLNRPGGGLTAWRPILNGNIRRAHGVLGSYNPIDGNLDKVLKGFWKRLRGESPIPTAFALSREFDGPTPQSWAVLYYANNATDTIKEMTADTLGAQTVNYLRFDSGSNVCGRGDEHCNHEFGRVDNDQGILLFDPKSLPNVSDIKVQAKTNLRADVSVAGAKLESISKPVVNDDNSVAFFGKIELDIKSTLSKEQAHDQAQTLVKEKLKAVADRTKFYGIQPVTAVADDGSKVSEFISGYLVEFRCYIDEIPVWEDYLRIRFCGDLISAVKIRTHTVVKGNVDEERMALLSFDDALSNALKELKEDLKIEGKYHILEAGLWYARDYSRTEKNNLEIYVPAWKVVIRKGGETNQVFIHAATGDYIGKCLPAEKE
jgi:hypothetical protein